MLKTVHLRDEGGRRVDCEKLARRIDLAFFSDHTSNGPDGLLLLANVQVVDAGDVYANVDPFAEAASLLEGVGTTVAAWATNSETALVLAKIKEETGSNKPLLQPDRAADAANHRRRTAVRGSRRAGAAIGDGIEWGWIAPACSR